MGALRRLRIIVSSASTCSKRFSRPVVEWVQAADAMSFAASSCSDPIRVGAIRQDTAFFETLATKQFLVF
jgi:hypothetical protein